MTGIQIREALKDADSKGKLSVVAEVVGITGGEDVLRKIMNSTEEINTMDRLILSAYMEEGKE